jgi:hypothetical protein
MQAALAQKGTHVSLRTVYRTMSEAGLIHRHRRPHGITKADTETQNRENLIKRNFSEDKPLKKLLTDITEVQCADGKLYVSPILDCFNGEIIALIVINMAYVERDSSYIEIELPLSMSLQETLEFIKADIDNMIKSCGDDMSIVAKLETNEVHVPQTLDELYEFVKLA